MSFKIKRNRSLYALLIIAVILIGLASRSQSFLLPSIIKLYAGDALWALTAYLMIAFLFPRLSVSKVAILAGMFSFTVEISQLYHAPWIDEIRRIRLGGLLLGHGFLWSDLICYCIGIGIGVLLERSRALRQFSKVQTTPA